MVLVIMTTLVLTGLYLFGKFGLSSSQKAEVIGLYTSLFTLIWGLLNIIYSYSGSSIMIGIIPRIFDTSFKEPLNNNISFNSTGNDSLDYYLSNNLYKGMDIPLNKEEVISSLQNATNSLKSFLDILTTPTHFDGLTIVFVLLTIIITPIAILASEKKTEMIASLLVVEALLIGAFVTYDFITFYALFEAVLIPMFFLIGGKGSGLSIFRTGAAYRLFLYTLAGSVLMLLGIIILYLETGTLNWHLLVLKNLSLNSFNTTNTLILHTNTTYDLSNNVNSISNLFTLSPALWIFPLIFVAFAVKVPMIPVHLWLPEAHTIAPTPGSMILAALLLKLGGYGILRWLLPVLPEACHFYMPFVLVIATISTLYACLTCLRQIDVKRIVAYSSIVHMNICIFSIFTYSSLAIKGAIFEMFSHGIISTGMFFLIGVVYNRHDTRTLKYFRGLALTMPLFSAIMFIFILANSAVPLTCGFIGEFIMLSGSLKTLPLLTIILTLATVVNAGYNIWLFNRMCFGGYSPYLTKSKDLTRKEFFVLAPLLLYILILGIKPNLIFMFIENSIF